MLKRLIDLEISKPNDKERECTSHPSQPKGKGMGKEEPTYKDPGQWIRGGTRGGGNDLLNLNGCKGMPCNSARMINKPQLYKKA